METEEEQCPLCGVLLAIERLPEHVEACDGGSVRRVAVSADEDPLGRRSPSPPLGYTANTNVMSFNDVVNEGAAAPQDAAAGVPYASPQPVSGGGRAAGGGRGLDLNYFQEQQSLMLAKQLQEEEDEYERRLAEEHEEERARAQRRESGGPSKLKKMFGKILGKTDSSRSVQSSPGPAYYDEQRRSDFDYDDGEDHSYYSDEEYYERDGELYDDHYDDGSGRHSGEPPDARAHTPSHMVVVQQGRPPMRFPVDPVVQQGRPPDMGASRGSAMTTWRAEAEMRHTVRKVRDVGVEKKSGLYTRGKVDDYYRLLQQIGEGATSTVFECVDREDGTHWALKKMKKPRLARRYRGAERARMQERRAEEVRLMESEIEMMRSVEHPCITRLRECFRDQRCMYLVIELCTGGDLYSELNDIGFFKERHAAEIMEQVLQALHYLHSWGFIHRDIKSENVFFVNRDSYDVKVADLGLMTTIEDCQTYQEICGTTLYMSPEMLAERGYSYGTDVWSAGVLAFELLSGQDPFTGRSEREIEANILRHDVYFDRRAWRDVSSMAEDFVVALMCASQRKRLTTRQALEHPWMRCLGVPDDLPAVDARLAAERRMQEEHERAEQHQQAAVAAAAESEAAPPGTGECPICLKKFPLAEHALELHVESCLTETEQLGARAKEVYVNKDLRTSESTPRVAADDASTSTKQRRSSSSTTTTTTTTSTTTSATAAVPKKPAPLKVKKAGGQKAKRRSGVVATSQKTAAAKGDTAKKVTAPSTKDGANGAKKKGKAAAGKKMKAGGGAVAAKSGGKGKAKVRKSAAKDASASSAAPVADLLSDSVLDVDEPSLAPALGESPPPPALPSEEPEAPPVLPTTLKLLPPKTASAVGGGTRLGRRSMNEALAAANGVAPATAKQPYINPFAEEAESAGDDSTTAPTPLPMLFNPFAPAPVVTNPFLPPLSEQHTKPFVRPEREAYENGDFEQTN